MDEVWGRELRRRRVQMGMSVKQAAKQSGISRATWKTWEDQTRRPQEHMASRVDRTLGWSLGTLYRLSRPQAR